MHAGMAAIGLALEFAKIKLGLEELKKHQTTAIRNFVEGHDLLVHLPTGFGKSVIFQAASYNRHRLFEWTAQRNFPPFA